MDTTTLRPVPVASAAPPRLVSLDACRGFVMFLMVAETLGIREVASALPESGFWQFLKQHQSHVEWTGCTLHDLIQPSFSFIVGVALPFSLASRLARGQSRWHLALHAFWRAFLLVALGIFLRSLGRPQTNFTFEDTLTQIGLGYGFLFLLGLRPRREQWLAFAAILAVYWGVFALCPLPGEGFDPATVGVPKDWEHGLAGFAAHWNKNTNLAHHFDVWFLNLFPRREPFTFNGGGYQTLSFIPTLATMLLGLLAGGVLKGERRAGAKSLSQKSLRRPEAEREAVRQGALTQAIHTESIAEGGRDRGGSGHRRSMAASQPAEGRRTSGIGSNLSWLAIAGLAGLAGGWALHRLGVCPIVKRLWTPSWVLFSGGWSLLILAGFYGVIEGLRLRAWAFPFVVIGMNSIAMYCMSWTMKGFVRDALRRHLPEGTFKVFGEAYEPLLQGTAIVLLFWLVLFWLHRRKVYLRI